MNLKHFMIHIQRGKDGRDFCYGVYAGTEKEARNRAYEMYVRRTGHGEYGKIITCEER